MNVRENPRSFVGLTMDGWLTLLCVFLAGIGCLFTYSLTISDSHTALIRRVLYVIVGFCFMYVISRVDYHCLVILSHLFYGMAVLFCFVYKILSQFLYTDAAISNYLVFRNYRVHVPLLLFTTTCLEIAVLLSRSQKYVSIIPTEFISLILLISTVHDIYLAFALVIFATAINMIVAKKNRIVVIIMPFVIFAAICSLMGLSSGRFLLRIQVWLDPFAYVGPESYATVQNLYGIASGGPLGMGYGNGTEAYFLPDSILAENVLAGISQEIGFIGAACVLLLFSLWAMRVGWIAVHAADRLGFFLAAVISLRLLILVMLHVLSVVNMLPHLILQLPFINRGNSELLVEFFLSGIALSVSRLRVSPIVGNNRREDF